MCLDKNLVAQLLYNYTLNPGSVTPDALDNLVTALDGGCIPGTSNLFTSILVLDRVHIENLNSHPIPFDITLIDTTGIDPVSCTVVFKKGLGPELPASFTNLEIVINNFTLLITSTVNNSSGYNIKMIPNNNFGVILTDIPYIKANADTLFKLNPGDSLTINLLYRFI